MRHAGTATRLGVVSVKMAGLDRPATPPEAGHAAVERAKIVALSTGVRIARDVLQELGGTEALTIHEYATTGGATLVLPGDVYVNAPFDEGFSISTSLRLVRGQDGLVLKLGSDIVPVVNVLPLPGYLDGTDSEGRLVRDTIMSHADRIRVSPIVGCAFNCDFCDLGTLTYLRRPVHQILEAIDRALDDDALPPRHLLISGGSPGAPDVHQAYFEETCRAIVRHVLARRPDFEIDIMMSPRQNCPEFVESMVEAGVTGFSLNIEVYSEENARTHLPLKYRASRPHLGPTISRAVDLLGRDSGNVRSLIIPGLESVEQTLEGVAWLSSLGCHPVLSPFRPARGTRLEGAAPASTSDLTAVLAGARAIARKHGVALGPRCIPCQHNTLSFPWDLE